VRVHTNPYLDVAGLDNLNIVVDVILGAKIHHLLYPLNAANERASHGHTAKKEGRAGNRDGLASQSNQNVFACTRVFVRMCEHACVLRIYEWM